MNKVKKTKIVKQAFKNNLILGRHNSNGEVGYNSMT